MLIWVSLLETTMAMSPSGHLAGAQVSLQGQGHSMSPPTSSWGSCCLLLSL